MTPECCSTLSIRFPTTSTATVTDDNARALILMMLLEELEEGYPERTRLTSIYAAFLQNAFDASGGRFRNFMTYRREWIVETGSEGSHGRASWALGTCVGRSRREGTTLLGGGAFRKGLAGGARFHVAAGMGVRHYRPARISSHIGRRSHGQSASRGIGAASARSLRSGCQPGLALVRRHRGLRT